MASALRASFVSAHRSIGTRAGWTASTYVPLPLAIRAHLHTSIASRQHARGSSRGEAEQDGRQDAESEEQRRRSNVLAQIRDVLHKKRSDLEPRLKRQLEQLGKRWNEYSGYEEVLEAKALVLEAEVQLKELREEQERLQQEYMQAVGKRANSQRTLNELLTRKDSWSETDLSTYTELLKSEHGDARHEKECSERYEAIAGRVNSAWDDVVRKTLDRYHQEQIWSDRVRAGSTYGSLVIAGVNVLIFIMAFIVVEPYKRKKLAQTFEGRLLEGEAVNAQMLAAVVQDFERHVETLERHGEDANKALGLLLTKAGIIIDGQSELQETPPQPPPPLVRSPESAGEKRRDMAMAGALGFAVGAGLLAAFGALQS